MHWASDGGAEGSAVDTGSGKGSRAPHACQRSIILTLHLSSIRLTWIRPANQCEGRIQLAEGRKAC